MSYVIGKVAAIRNAVEKLFPRVRDYTSWPIEILYYHL